ncbi:MAG: asparagine synthase-related protein, partial [Ignisphaera sp.]
MFGDSLGVKKLHRDVGKVIEELMEWFRGVEKPIVVALSGGIDSSVVLITACKALGRENVIAVTAVSPIRLEEDLEWAKEISSLLGVEHVIVETSELNDSDFVANPPNRCYICKKYLAEKLVEVAR